MICSTTRRVIPLPEAFDDLQCLFDLSRGKSSHSLIKHKKVRPVASARAISSLFLYPMGRPPARLCSYPQDGKGRGIPRLPCGPVSASAPEGKPPKDTYPRSSLSGGVQPGRSSLLQDGHFVGWQVRNITAIKDQFARSGLVKS